jgi:hypothetical protein
MFVVDPVPTPLTDAGAAAPAIPGRAAGPGSPSSDAQQTRAGGRVGSWLAIGLIALVCSLHGLAIWQGMGGLAGLTNGWPLWRHDHSLYYHSAIVTRAFLRTSGTTAGYDPSFMAGYAKSVVFPASSTLPELVVAVFGGSRPDLAYKFYVLISVALVPWLIALACVLLRVPPAGAGSAVVIWLVYLWTDWPINYAGYGMVPYFLAIPLAIVGLGAFARFLERGGALDWWFATVTISVSFLVHFTSMMVLLPGAALAYFAASAVPRTIPDRKLGIGNDGTDRAGSPTPRTLGRRGHAAVWLIPAVVLAVNSFWWLPGVWLGSTKGASDFAFYHPEGVAKRLMQILWAEAPMEAILVAMGLPGLVLLIRRDRIAGCALMGFAGAGMFWGYLAGGSRALDFLQPGRHTYAFYTALAVFAGVSIEEFFRRLQKGAGGIDHLDKWVMAGALLVAIRIMSYPVYDSLRSRLWSRDPFLSSRPSRRLRWVVDRVGKYLKPGDRLLYEEGGKDLPDARDPFDGGRFSGLLPERTGVKLIGGPYLHAALKTNFTQFGEGKLCGKENWQRADFIRYAKLYGPDAIVCWSPHARRFCHENGDLIQVLDDDGTVLVGRVLGFGGDFLSGSGKVEATPGRIRVRELVPGLDGWVVLRYHSVPYLKTYPSVACQPEYWEDDPVPFIRLRPPSGTSEVELELRLPSDFRFGGPPAG